MVPRTRWNTAIVPVGASVAGAHARRRNLLWKSRRVVMIASNRRRRTPSPGRTLLRSGRPAVTPSLAVRAPDLPLRCPMVAIRRDDLLERTFANAAGAPGRPLHLRHLARARRPGRNPAPQSSALRDGSV